MPILGIGTHQSDKIDFEIIFAEFLLKIVKSGIRHRLGVDFEALG